jgi:hypothetical protein
VCVCARACACLKKFISRQSTVKYLKQDLHIFELLSFLYVFLETCPDILILHIYLNICIYLELESLLDFFENDRRYLPFFKHVPYLNICIHIFEVYTISDVNDITG